MSRRILVANLHPARVSLSSGLAQAYQKGAAAGGHQLRLSSLSDMQFDPDFGQAGYKQSKPLEADLVKFQEDLLWAEHVVFVGPLWWGGLPAKAKGLFDRVLLPGYAFDPRVRSMGLPKPLLKGRTSRLILTSDTPGWAFRLLYRQALRHQMQRQILGFTGIAPMRLTFLAPVDHSTQTIRTRWLSMAEGLGRKAA